MTYMFMELMFMEQYLSRQYESRTGASLLSPQHPNTVPETSAVDKLLQDIETLLI